MALPSSPPATRDTERHEYPVASAILRLSAEFAGSIDPQIIRRTVLGCREELDGSPIGALPELVERLARQRLLQSVGTHRA